MKGLPLVNLGMTQISKRTMKMDNNISNFLNPGIYNNTEEEERELSFRVPMNTFRRDETSIKTPFSKQ